MIPEILLAQGPQALALEPETPRPLPHRNDGAGALRLVFRSRRVNGLDRLAGAAWLGEDAERADSERGGAERLPDLVAEKLRRVEALVLRDRGRGRVLQVGRVAG